MGLNNATITPKTHPGHPIVGHHYAGCSDATHHTEIFLCNRYDLDLGYWLTNIANPHDEVLADVSDMGRASVKAHDRGDHWYIWRWCQRATKVQTSPAIAD